MASWHHAPMAMRRTTLADYEQRILRAQKLLEARLDETIAPADLAKAAHFSLHHFHRIFRAQVGETVMQHVRRLRIERAARRLRASDERIVVLALEAGYESHEAFTRAFVDRFGVPPSEFRETPSLRLGEWERSRGADAAASASRPSADVTVQTFPAVRVAFMRHRGGYKGIDAFWRAMLAWAAPRGLLAHSSPLYGVCPDDPDVTAEEHLRFDACVAVDDDFRADDAVGVTEIPGGTYAVGNHVGPYDRLAETYFDVIGRWFPKSGYELAPDAVVEHYLNDPSITAPSELRTEVRVKVAE
jgi:AraC family transcriptional regulator